MSANSDVEQAILTAWQTAGLNGAQSPDSVAGGPGTGPVTGGIARLPRPRDNPGPTKRPPMPYATLEVKKDPKPNEFSSNGTCIDYRRVTITIYGVGEAAVGAVVESVLEGLYLTTARSWISLTIPNAAWMRTEYVSSDTDISQPVAGQDVRMFPMEFTVWSHRQTVP